MQIVRGVIDALLVYYVDSRTLRGEVWVALVEGPLNLSGGKSPAKFHTGSGGRLERVVCL